MQVTINLEPFNGTISLEHYGFNPCEFKNLYRSQLNGKYEDMVFRLNDSYLTTCVAQSPQFSLKSYCHNIETNVSFPAYFTIYDLSKYFKAVKIEFRINPNPNPGFQNEFPKWVIHKAELIEFLSTCFVLSIGYENYIAGRYFVRLLLILVYFLNFYLIVIRQGSLNVSFD